MVNARVMMHLKQALWLAISPRATRSRASKFSLVRFLLSVAARALFSVTEEESVSGCASGASCWGALIRWRCSGFFFFPASFRSRLSWVSSVASTRDSSPDIEDNSEMWSWQSWIMDNPGTSCDEHSFVGTAPIRATVSEDLIS